MRTNFAYVSIIAHFEWWVGATPPGFLTPLAQGLVKAKVKKFKGFPRPAGTPEERTARPEGRGSDTTNARSFETR